LSERWYVSHIFLRQDTYAQRDNVLLEAIKPTVEELEKEDLIENFHFLFEGNFEILFRVRLRSTASMDKVKSLVGHGLQKIESLCSRITYDETYTGEGTPQTKDSFGEEGWLLAQRFMDVCSHITLLTREVVLGKKPLTAARLDSLFNKEKFVHLLLNQYGLDPFRESQFHSLGAIERVIVGFRILQRLERLEKALQDHTKQQNDTSAS
jgi:hypothetical protein